MLGGERPEPEVRKPLQPEGPLVPPDGFWGVKRGRAVPPWKVPRDPLGYNLMVIVSASS